MKAAWFGVAFSTALVSGFCAHAQDAGVFDKWINQDSSTCVPVSEFKKVSTVKELTPDQFQFVRAFYIAIPPLSRSLPPGDHAIIANAGGQAMVALVDGIEACARFLAPDYFQAMLVKVGEEPGQIGAQANRAAPSD